MIATDYNQLMLVRDTTKSKTIVHVPVDACVISEYNPRRLRDSQKIAELAKRIERNGFEITRALWAYAQDGQYHIFAGGNRLEAVKRTSIVNVPIVLHEGYTPDDFVGLADQDNENDEYHAPVPIVDKWMEYKRLADRDWTQQRIADAKGMTREAVKLILQYAALPASVIALFGKNDFLKESHAAELGRLVNFTKAEPWLSREAAMTEVATDVIAKHGKTVTAKHFAEKVTQYNDVIKYVATVADSWGDVIFYDGDTSYAWDARAHFLNGCADRKARTLQAVKQAEHETRKRISENLRQHREYLTAKAEEAEREAAKTKPIEVKSGQWWKLGAHRLYCGDTSDPAFYGDIKNAAFAFADPPYNAGVDDWDKDFAWQHDWLQDIAPIVAVTPGIASIQDFMGRTKMLYAWSIACWIDNGMTRGAVGFGNWIYVALFATESLYRNSQDFLRVSVNLQDENESRFQGFKGRKPIELISKLVETFTKQGDVVVDPFMGSGTTLFVSEQLGRVCIGGEIDPDRCKLIIEEWQDTMGIMAEAI